jgi:hypothetical protein
MEIANAALEMLWRLSDEILKTLRETPAGASERAMVREFEARGTSAEMFYGIVAELEDAGLVKREGNLLFRSLLN